MLSSIIIFGSKIKGEFQRWRKLKLIYSLDLSGFPLDLLTLKTCTPRRPPNRPDDHLASLENPSDPQYNFSAHQVSTTNVSKKSFNICPIETYTRYGMKLCFIWWMIFFRFYKVLSILLLYLMLLFIDCNYDKKNLRKVNNSTFFSLLKGEISRYFIKSSQKFPLKNGVSEASWEGMSLNILFIFPQNIFLEDTQNIFWWERCWKAGICFVLLQ